MAITGIDYEAEARRFAASLANADGSANAPPVDVSAEDEARDLAARLAAITEGLDDVPPTNHDTFERAPTAPAPTAPAPTASSAPAVVYTAKPVVVVGEAKSRSGFVPNSATTRLFATPTQIKDAAEITRFALRALDVSSYALSSLYK